MKQLSKQINIGGLKEIAFHPQGFVRRVIGITIEVSGLSAPIGARCVISADGFDVMADVVGFKDDVTLLQSLGENSGLKQGMLVELVSKKKVFNYSEGLLGCVIDPVGNILLGDADCTTSSTPLAIDGAPLSISERGDISERFISGVRVVDSLFPIGVGQRMGLFAGTGVGKSVLLGMITQFSDADIVVVGLIGERGREVSEFAQKNLSEEARKKTVIVAAPADYPPILRMQGAEVATAIAEYYRDKGLKVLLLMDSVTRYAQAQREVALSTGEPPASKGFPPSVFAKLPYLIERAGVSLSGGSITAIYTVLSDGDDVSDPVSDAARGVLDGHIVLSRTIASKGIYPAIDIPNSISRIAQDVLNDKDYMSLLKLKGVYSLLNDNMEMIGLGLIEPGKNVKLDRALSLQTELDGFITQGIKEKSDLSATNKMFNELSNKI